MISVFDSGTKHCRKRTKCWLPAFSTFPTMFSKAFSSRVDRSLDCVVKGLTAFFLRVAKSYPPKYVKQEYHMRVQMLGCGVLDRG